MAYGPFNWSRPHKPSNGEPVVIAVWAVLLTLTITLSIIRWGPW